MQILADIKILLWLGGYVELSRFWLVFFPVFLWCVWGVLCQGCGEFKDVTEFRRFTTNYWGYQGFTTPKLIPPVLAPRHCPLPPRPVWWPAVPGWSGVRAVCGAGWWCALAAVPLRSGWRILVGDDGSACSPFPFLLFPWRVCFLVVLGVVSCIWAG